MSERNEVEALRRENALKTAVLDVGRILFTAGELEPQLAAALARLGEALAAASLLMYRGKPDVEHFHHYGEWSPASPEVSFAREETQNVTAKRLGIGFALDRLRQGSCVTRPLADLPGSARSFWRRDGGAHLALVPLWLTGEWRGMWGILVCVSQRPLSPPLRQTLLEAGRVIGARLMIGKVHEAEREARRQSEVLREFARIVNTSLSPEKVLQQALTQLRRVLTFDSVSIFLTSYKGQPEFVAGAGYDDPEMTTQAATDLLKSSPILAQMAADHQPVLSPDVRDLPGWIWVPGAEQVRSFMAVPLLRRDRMLGVAMLDSRQEDFFTPEDLQIVETLAQHLAVAVDNARLFEARARQLRLAHTLQRVGALHTTSLSPTAVYESLFDLLAQVINYDSVSLQLLHPEEKYLELVASRGFPDQQMLQKKMRKLGSVAMAKVADPPYWAVIMNASADLRWKQVAGTEQIRSWIGAALRVKGRLIGVLNVDSNTSGTYDNNMGEMVAAFANQAAVAIENAQLYERLREMTEDLTRQVAERTADLQAERDRTMAILESAGQGIILTDLGMEIVYVNSAMERQSGYARLVLTGRPLQSLLSDEVSDADFSQMQQTVQAGRGWSGEWVVSHQDGHTYDVAITISPFRAPDKSINGFVAVLTDITRLKEVERLKTRFVSNVSHELRTPLTNIKMYLTLLERGRAERRQAYLAVLQEETARLAQLIQDLLDLSQLEEDMPSQDVRADAAAVLQNVLTSLASRAEAKEVELRQEMEGPLPQATIAPQLLAQVMANLVDNAIAYTPAQGEVCLTGGTAWRRQRPFIWMRVADNGPGILPEELPHLFDRFYRGRQGEERKVPGTGLGLAICKEIVTRYGGYIDVDSAPGEGAAFTVWLPAVEPAPSSLPEAAGGAA